MILKETVAYQDQSDQLEGWAAYPSKGKHPLVILCHAWKGRDAFICTKAEEMAKWGYVGFALDLYGKDVLGETNEACAKLKQPFIQDREKLQRRISQAYEVAKALPNVDATRIAVIGFGFGGIGALDLARSGANLKGVVTIYGHYFPPPAHLIKPIKAKVLALHGYLDPLTSLEELKQFQKEMSEANVDWQLHLYGKAMHAFATPGVNLREKGLQHDLTSEKRAWVTTRDFLREIFQEE